MKHINLLASYAVVNKNSIVSRQVSRSFGGLGSREASLSGWLALTPVVKETGDLLSNLFRVDRRP